MTVTVSGMAIAGKTRALPEVMLYMSTKSIQVLLVISKADGKWQENAAEHWCMMQVVRQDVATSIQQKAAKALTAAKLKAVDGILWGQKPSHKAGQQAAYCI